MKKITTNRNLGIEILRAILCLWVVLFHCSKKYTKNHILFIIISKYYHAPCFAFISFYFSSNSIKDINIELLKTRFERLLIPYLVYPLLIWIINNLTFLIFSVSRFKRIITFYELYNQILFGCNLIVSFWFLFCLLFFNIVFVLLSYLLKPYFIFIIKILGIVVYFFYSSRKYNYFYNYPKFIRLSLTDSLSIFPLCVFSIALSSSNFITNLNFNIGNEIIIVLFILILFNKNIFSDTNKYYGIENILASFLLFIFFYSLPLYKSSSKMKLLIKRITSYTNGIYCLHTIITFYIRLILNKRNTLVSSFLIYFTSYIISFLSIKIFGKTKLKYLFI